MKKYVFELKDPLLKMVFDDGLLKERKDLLQIILEACRFMMYNDQVPNANNKVMLVVNDMNRLFFCSKKKMFSVMCPFHVTDSPSISFDYNKIPIDSEIISMISMFLDSDEYNAKEALDFITQIEDFQEKGKRDLWLVIKHFLTFELGYVRYDDNLEEFNKASKEGHPKRHPRYHYDVNLDSQATFKLGLSSQLTPSKFVDFLDNTKDRHVIK